MSNDEDKEASATAQAVDDLVGGGKVDPGNPRGVPPAVVAAQIIRASLKPPALGASRVAALSDRVAGQWAWRRRRRVVRTILAVAATFLVVVFVSVLTRSSPVPVRQQSRETAALIPGPFPDGQTESDRIDLIYADRLDGLREATLAGVRP